jgi:hypothetical protein
VQFSQMFWEGSSEVHLWLALSIWTHRVSVQREEPWPCPCFRGECTANRAGFPVYPKKVSPQSLSVNYHANVHSSSFKQGIYCCTFQ